MRTPPPDGRPGFRLGSGYLVVPGLVLTVRHALVPPHLPTGRQIAHRCAVSAWHDAGEPDRWVDGEVVAEAGHLDLAVVAVPGLGDGLAPVRWGRLAGDRPVRWDATGFPRAGITPAGRQPEHAWGEVSPITQAFEGRLGLQVQRSPARSAAGDSGWAGLSGAAVFAAGRLVGVVVEDPIEFAESLTAVRIERLTDHDALFTAVGRPRFDDVDAAGTGDRDRHGQVTDVVAAARRLAEELPYASIRQLAIRTGPLPPLSQVYIQQRQQRIEDDKEPDRDPRRRRGPDEAQARRETVPVQVTAEEALGRHRNLVIEAGPGLGKSTLLHHLVLALGEGPVVGRLVPVRISARRLVGVQGTVPARVAAALETELASSMSVPPDLFLTPPTPDATWLLLIDALDEVVDPIARTDLVATLHQVVSGAALPLRLVVTSRPLPELAGFGTDDFGRFRLQPFGPSERRALATNWFRTRSLSPEATAEAFLAAVDDSRITDLAESPLLLTIAALLFEQAERGDLPSSRAGLYAAFVELLVEGEEDTRATRAGFVQTWITRLGQDGALATLFQRTGLVGVYGGELAFVHDTFREYLAARALTRSTPLDSPAARALIKRWNDRNQREVVLFAIGIWSERDLHHDATPLLRTIWRPGSLPEASVFVGSAIAEGLAVDPTYEEQVVDSVVRFSRRSSGRRGDGIDVLVRLRRTEEIRSLADNSSRYRSSRRGSFQAAVALVSLGHREEAIDLLDRRAADGSLEAIRGLATIDEASRAVDHLRRLMQSGTLPRGGSHGDFVALLGDLGHPEEAAEAARSYLEQGPDRYDDGTFDPDVAGALGRFGHADEAAPLLADTACSGRRPPLDRMSAVGYLSTLQRPAELAQVALQARGPAILRDPIRSAAHEALRLLSEDPSAGNDVRGHAGEAFSAMPASRARRLSGRGVLAHMVRFGVHALLSLAAISATLLLLARLSDRYDVVLGTDPPPWIVGGATLVWALLYAAAARQYDSYGPSGMAAVRLPLRGPFLPFRLPVFWYDWLPGWPIGPALPWVAGFAAGSTAAAVGAPAAVAAGALYAAVVATTAALAWDVDRSGSPEPPPAATCRWVRERPRSDA